MKTIELTCDGCGTSFTRTAAAHKANLKRGRKIVACSNKCVSAARFYLTEEPQEYICKECDKSFSRKRGGKEDTLSFCSQSCANRFNNRKRKRKYSAGLCVICGDKEVSTKRGKYCSECKRLHGFSGRRQIDYDTVTLGELRARYSRLEHHAKVRGIARVVYGKHHADMSCEYCGYSLQIDVCHIRPLADFPDSATISEINHIDNLIGLDKRCHWEFDNGYLTLEEIRGRHQTPPGGGA